jgi:hypothetical protein
MKSRNIRIWSLSLLLITIFTGFSAFAQVPTSTVPPKTLPQKRTVNSVSDSEKALEVRGQSRNLSMMLVLKNRKDSIDFVKPRETYSEEIKNTGF